MSPWDQGVAVPFWSPLWDVFPPGFGGNPGSCEPDCLLSVFVFQGVVPTSPGLMVNQERDKKEQGEGCVDGEHFGISWCSPYHIVWLVSIGDGSDKPSGGPRGSLPRGS
jgi:hypothetical protein